MSSSRHKDSFREEKRSTAHYIGQQLSLLCTTVSLELFHEKGISCFVETYSDVRRKAKKFGIDDKADIYLSRLLAISLYRAGTRENILLLIKAIIKITEKFPKCALYIYQDIAKSLRPQDTDVAMAVCYVILRIAPRLCKVHGNDSRAKLMYHLITRFHAYPHHLTPQYRKPMAAMLRVIRACLTTPCGNLVWPLCIHLNRLMEKVNHPMLKEIASTINARLNGVSSLMQGMGTNNFLCPAFGISDMAAIRRICYASARRSADIKSLIYTIRNLLADNAPIDHIVPNDLFAAHASGQISTVSTNWRNCVCSAIVQRILSLIHNSPRRRPNRRQPTLTPQWLILAGQIHALMYFNLIDFVELVNSLYERLKNPNPNIPGVYRDNRIIWLLSQCMTLENAKNVMTESVNKKNGLVLRIEEFYEPNPYRNHEVVHKLLQSFQQQPLSSPIERLNRVMAVVYNLSIQSVLFRVTYLDKQQENRFEFKGNAKDVAVDSALVEWWNKKKDFEAVTDQMLVKLALLSSMSSKEVANKLVDFLCEHTQHHQIMPGSLFVSRRVNPLPEILLGVLSEGVKKHLRSTIHEKLAYKNLGQEGEPASPALVLTFSRLLRSSAFFGIHLGRFLLLSQIVDEKGDNQGKIFTAGPTQILRHIILEIIAYPLFRFAVHCDVIRRFLTKLAPLAHRNLHPQVTLLLQHVLLKIALVIAHVPDQGSGKADQGHAHTSVSSVFSAFIGKRDKDKEDEAAASQEHKKSFGILTDRLLFLSFARVVRLSNTRSRSRINVDLPLPFASLLPSPHHSKETGGGERGGEKAAQSHSASHGHTSTMVTNSSSASLHSPATPAKSKSSVERQKGTSSSHAGGTTSNVGHGRNSGHPSSDRFGSTEATKYLENFMSWFQSLPHARRSFASHTIRCLPRCMRERLVERETILLRERAEQLENSSKPKNEGSEGPEGKRSYHTSPAFVTWESAKQAADNQIIKNLLLSNERDKAHLERVRSYYEKASSFERALFLPAVAYAWIMLNDMARIDQFRDASVLSVVQRFTAYDLQLGAACFVDAALDYIRYDNVRNVFKVQQLLVAVAHSAQGPIIPIEHLILCLSDHPSGESYAMDLALYLLTETEHGAGLVQRRNKVVKLLAQKTPQEIMDGVKDGGLRFREHLMYHQTFKTEIPAMYNEDGWRVGGHENILSLYHSSELARVMPAIDVVIWRLIESGRVNDLTNVVSMVWPLYHVFHATPVTFVMEILCYYDGIDSLDIHCIYELLRLVPNPVSCGVSGDVKSSSHLTTPTSSAPQSNNPTTDHALHAIWTKTFRFLGACHFSDPKRHHFSNCPEYPLNKDGCNSTSNNDHNNDVLMGGKQMEEEWEMFLSTEDDKGNQDEDEKEKEDKKDEKVEIKGRLLGPGVASLDVQKGYIFNLVRRIAELMPLQKHTPPGILENPPCASANEFASPLRRALAFATLEILAQTDHKIDPGHQCLASLLLDTFVIDPPLHLIQDSAPSASGSTANAAPHSSSSKKKGEVMHQTLQGLGILMAHLPTGVQDAIIDLILHLAIPQILLSAISPSTGASIGGYGWGTDETTSPMPSSTKPVDRAEKKAYMVSSASRHLRQKRMRRSHWQNRPPVKRAMLRRKRKMKEEKLDPLLSLSSFDDPFSSLLDEQGAEGKDAKHAGDKDTDGNEKTDCESYHYGLDASSEQSWPPSKLLAPDMKTIRRWHSIIWSNFNAVTRKYFLTADHSNVASPRSTGSGASGGRNGCENVNSSSSLPETNNDLFEFQFGPIEGGLFPRIPTTPGEASQMKSSTPGFQIPESFSPLGRLMTLLEGCFSWSKARVFEKLCRRLGQWLHAGTALPGATHRQIWAEAPISHVIPLIQILAFGFQRFKGDIAVMETVLRVSYYVLRALNVVVVPQQANEVLQKTRVVFDFIAYLHTSAHQYISKATSRELLHLIRQMHPQWRSMLICHK